MDEETINEEARVSQEAEAPVTPEQAVAVDPYMAYLRALHQAQVAQDAAAAAQEPAPQEPAPQEETPAQEPQPEVSEQPFEGIGMERLTPQQYTAGTYTQPAQSVIKEEKPAGKKVSHVWIPVLVIVAILLGLGGAVLGYSLASKNTRAAAQPTEEIQRETLSKESERSPISENIHTNDSGETQTPAQIYSGNVGAVVGIGSESTGRNVWGQTVTQASSGSGFIITADGYVVTNYHVVEGASSVTVQLYDGKEYPATVVGYENATCDVALLKIDAQDLPTVSVGDSDSIQVGEQVCAIGNPLGELTFTLTVGYISALDREINTDGSPINMFQTDAAINSGNSGGPLFDMNGNVIGITTAKYSGSTSSGTTVEGLGFAIPINDVMAIIDDLTQFGYVTGKPYLGVTVGDSGYYGENLPAGAYIGEVQEGHAASKAGLQVGDVIVGVGDSVVGSQADLQTALSAHSAGETVSVTVYRAGQYLTMSVTLDERPREADLPQESETVPEPTETEAPQEESEDPFGWGFGDFGFGWPFP